MKKGMNATGTIYFATCREWREGVYLTQEHVTILENYFHARDHASDWGSFYKALSRPTVEYLSPFLGPWEDSSWSSDLATVETYYPPETPMSELIEKDYLIGAGLGDATPMIQCANDSYRALDLECVDPFKENELINDCFDLDTPMYSKSKFYDMSLLLKEQGYRVEALDWTDYWKPRLSAASFSDKPD